MVKRKSTIVLVLAIVVIALVLFCTIGNTIYAVDQINKLKESARKWGGDTEEYDRMIFATICTYFVQGIVLILPALTAFHLTCSFDDKNAVAYAKAHNQRYTGYIKNHGLPVIIEAGAGFLVCLVMSIFAGSTYGWGDKYSVPTFFQSMQMTSVFCGIHFINAFIISAFDEHNRIKLSEMNGGSSGYSAPAYPSAQTYYNGYNQQFTNPQFTNPQMQQPAAPQQYNNQFAGSYDPNMRRY